MDWNTFAVMQLGAVPYFLVFLAGACLAVIRWKRHPTVSLLALCAFLILLVNLLGNALLQVWIVLRSQYDLPAAQIGSLNNVATVVRTAGGTIAWILLLCALYGWRFEDTSGSESPGP